MPEHRVLVDQQAEVVDKIQKAILANDEIDPTATARLQIAVDKYATLLLHPPTA